MNLGIDFRDQLNAVSTWICDQLDRSFGQIRGIWLVEHKADGTHGAIHADSVAITGDLTVGRYVGPLAFGDALGTGTIKKEVITPNTFTYTGFPSMGTSTNGPDVISSTLPLVPSADGLKDLGHSGTTQRRWRNGLFTNVVEGAFIHAVTALYERSRSTAVGEWLTTAFAAGDYTASAGAWTVIAANVITPTAYTLVGKTITVAFDIANTNVTAAASLRLAIPGGFVAAKRMRTITNVRDVGVAGFGLAIVRPAQTYIEFYASAGAANFAITAGSNTDVSGEITFEVQ